MYVTEHNRCAKALHFSLVALANPNFKRRIISNLALTMATDGLSRAVLKFIFQLFVTPTLYRHKIQFVCTPPYRLFK